MAKFHYYQDVRGEWRWRFRATGGKIVADSGQGYVDKHDCLRGIEIVRTEAATAEIVQDESEKSVTEKG